MKHWLRAIVLIPVAILLIGFALANRPPVTLNLDPFGLGNIPTIVDIPLFLPIYVGIMMGILVGGTVMWITQGRHRKAVRMHRRTIDMQRRELDQITANRSLPPPSIPPVG